MDTNDNLKDRLYIDVSNELRIPINGIQTITESLLSGQEGELNNTQTDSVKLINRTLLHLKDMLNDIKELSQLQSGEISYDFINFDLNDLFKVTVPVINALLRYKPIELEIDIQDNLPEITGDLRGIRKVIMNFLTNAVKYTKFGTIIIKARSFKNFIEVSVIDTGIGIRKGELNVIFKQLKEFGSIISPELEGSGLGLSISKKIIEDHGGKIGVKSVTGKGSTFYFKLPRTKNEENGKDFELNKNTTQSYKKKNLKLLDFPVENNLNSHENLVLNSVPLGNNELILIVDDSQIELQVLKKLLTSFNYRVISAENGKKAIDIINDKPVKLVITDLTMPVINGFELCMKIKSTAKFKNVPVIILSTSGIIDDAVYSLNVGADDYIKKPYNRYELQARINSLLRLSKTQSKLEELNEKLEERVNHRTRQLHNVQEQLIQSEKMSCLGKMTAGITHEINNPLAFVISNIDMLKDKIFWLQMIYAIYKSKYEIENEFDLTEIKENFSFLHDPNFTIPYSVSKLTKDFYLLLKNTDKHNIINEFNCFSAELLENISKEENSVSTMILSINSLFLRSINGLKRIKNLIKDLKSFSRQEEIVKKDCDIHELINESLNIVRNQLVATNIKVIKEFKIDELVNCNSVKMSQVLINIILNAIQAMKNKGTLSLQTQKKGNFYIIKIIDNGCGMNDEVRKQIFDLFYTTKPVGKGTGLGLSISYKIIEQHKGTIKVNSKPGQGTVIEIDLPDRQILEIN